MEGLVSAKSFKEGYKKRIFAITGQLALSASSPPRSKKKGTYSCTELEFGPFDRR